MLLAYIVLIILFFVIAVLFIITLKFDGRDSDIFQATIFIGLVIIEVIVIIGLIGSVKTGKKYRQEYDKLIQSIERDKNKVFEENGEITDIYITVNGEEHHFKFKEENSNE